MDKMTDPITELLAIGMGALYFAAGVYVIIYGLESVAKYFNKGK